MHASNAPFMSDRASGLRAPRRLVGLVFSLALVMPATATTALAHASDRGFVLLLPTGYYAFAGAAAVTASFLVLAILPSEPVLRLFAARLPLVGIPRRGVAATSLLSFACLAVLVAAGLLGSRDPLSNPLPLVVWTLLWVGLTLAQGTIGDLWRWLNPWSGPLQIAGRVAGRRRTPLSLPRWVGFWPAALFFFGFAWFELIDPAPDDPERLAAAVACYWTASFAAMLLVGERWRRRGEFLSVFFDMLARLAVLGRQGRRLCLCWPGAQLATVRPLPASGVVFLILALASVSFDGLSKTFFWLGINGVNPLEFPGRSAMTGINTAGLVLTFAALWLAFQAAVRAGAWLGGIEVASGKAAGLYVWSIVPIALAYHFAHYLTLLAVNAQYALVALSDPFSRGWNLFGTAYWPVSPGIVAGAGSAWVLWNLQAGAIILGHVVAVLVAHRLALRLVASRRAAALGQAPLALLMVGYTVFGLWLLSTPTAG